MATEMDSVFDKELGVQAHAATVIADRTLTREALAAEYQQLADEYNELLLDTMKMTRQSDSSQKKLLDMQEKLDRQTKTDGLTGLYNRRHLDTVLAQAFADAHQNKALLTVAISDVDFFKKVNDTYSHQTGDEVLKAVAKVLQSSVRETDTVARYGGEEFVIIFPNTALADGVAFGERVRQRVQAHPWHEIHPDLKITISMGISADLTAPNHEKMLSAADEKLYEAKHNGRNQVRH